jgi:D-amino-acid dehydrogenase
VVAERVVVVGAGIVGLCTAEALMRDGFDVVVLERGPRDRDGASFGNAGLIVPSHVVPLAAPGVLGQGLRWLLDRESPFTVRPRLDLDLVRWGLTFVRSATAAHVARSAPLLRDLHLRSKALHLALAERLGSPAAAPRGGGVIVVCAGRHALEEETALAERAVALGLRAEVLGAADVAARVAGPEVRCVGGVHYLDDAHASPRALMLALQAHLEERGARLRWDADVAGVERAGGRVSAVRLRDGELVATERVVLAGGVASARLARSLGAYVPLQAGRGYSVTLDAAEQRPALPLLLSEARVAVTPLPEGVRIGGTMEIAAPDRPVDPRRVRGIARSTERFLPGYRSEVLTALPVWTGARPVSADGMPYIGPLRGAPSVVVAAGHGMMGFSLGPVTGALVADLVAGRTPEIDLGPLAPERFAGRRGR